NVPTAASARSAGVGSSVYAPAAGRRLKPRRSRGYSSVRSATICELRAVVLCGGTEDCLLPGCVGWERELVREVQTNGGRLVVVEQRKASSYPGVELLAVDPEVLEPQVCVLFLQRAHIVDDLSELSVLWIPFAYVRIQVLLGEVRASYRDCVLF